MRSDSDRARRPFKRLHYADLPPLPRRPHRYFQSIPHQIDMESAGLGSLRIHYRTYWIVRTAEVTDPRADGNQLFLAIRSRRTWFSL